MLIGAMPRSSSINILEKKSRLEKLPVSCTTLSSNLSFLMNKMKRPTFVSTQNEIMMPFFSPTKVELTLEMLKIKLRFLLSKLVKKILSTRLSSLTIYWPDWTSPNMIVYPNSSWLCMKPTGGSILLIWRLIHWSSQILPSTFWILQQN